MVELTEQAQQEYEDYMHKVRTYIASSGVASPDEVTSDLEAHVAEELKDAAEPVGIEDMQRVLLTLGAPEQWVSDEDIPWWRRMLLQARMSQEHIKDKIDHISSEQCGSSTRDMAWYRKILLVLSAEPAGWVLAYASFGLLVIGALVYGALPIISIMAIFVVLSFLVSRAALAKGIIFNSVQKWLVYPSLIVVYIALLVVLMIWVPLVIGASGYSLSFAAIQQGHIMVDQGSAETYLGPLPQPDRPEKLAELHACYAGAISGLVTAICTGLWWILLGTVMLLRKPGKLAKAIFEPFAVAVNKIGGWAGILLGTTLLLMGLSATASVLMMKMIQF